MAPKKRASSSSSSSSRKSNQAHQPSQPSKFGIQHFFERHSQSQAATAAASANPNPHLSQCTPSPGRDLPQPPPAPLVTDVVDSMLEISPEISKSGPPKRFRFSPGLLIKQSQDDGGGDEITWKISPVNERLKSIAEKQLPGMTRIFSEDLKAGAPMLRPCSQKQINSCSTGKLEKWLASSNMMAPDGPSTGSAYAVETEACIGLGKSGGHRQSPFRTPPSLSCRPSELIGDANRHGVPDHLGSWQHRKTLLELLDQVEDAITEESASNSSISCNGHDAVGWKMNKKHNLMKKGSLETPLSRVLGGSCDQTFLVLEVTEKHVNSIGLPTHHPLKVLRLLNEQTGQERTLHLYDEWFYSFIEPGDTVIAIGEFDECGNCVINRDNNLVIVHPDILVSGTRVAASFHCSRRAVLDERLKCAEHSTTALLGTLLHQIFQAALLKDQPTRQFLEEYAGIVIKKNIESLYACGANEKDVYLTLIAAIPRLLNWISCFREAEESKAATVEFGDCNGQIPVSITEVLDIEEMACAPIYGLKGMIDASVTVKMASKDGGWKEKIMPLEFKTGKGNKGQSAMEHRAQVILYTIMMSERYLTKDIDYGLLYYLQTGETQGIKVQRSDLVGLIMRRNELATDILRASTMQSLPPMLKNPVLCRGCRHLSSCTIYHKVYGGNTQSSGLGDIFDSHVEHVTVAYSNFLKQWDRLIDLEAKSSQVTEKASLHRQRSRRGHSMNRRSYVILDTKDGLSAVGSSLNGRFLYHFVPQSFDAEKHGEEKLGTAATGMSNSECSLRCGDRVVLSTKSGHVAVANGTISDISHSRVAVTFPRRLRLPRSNSCNATQSEDLIQEVWCIDKDEVSSSFAVMRYNLVQLFHQSSQGSRLRKIIVDLEAPRFDSGGVFSQDPAVSYLRSEKNLNEDQRRAIHKILTAKDYTLILGMPGTGKTSTMVHAVKALLLRGSSVLLTSYTNSAIDNLLLKLKAEGVDFIRLGRLEAIHEEIRGHCPSASEMHIVEDIKQRMEQVRVVGVTCLGINHPLLADKTFDICIMDEAGQITLPVSLGPLMLASTFVLVGDHYQLPPLVQSTEAQENGMGVSLFCRLSEAHPQAISALQCQYRMAAGIMELSNALIYGNRLRCGSPEIANSKLELSGTEPYTLWIKEVLDPNRSVIFINTDLLFACESKEHKLVNNPMEAHIISKVVMELVKREISCNEIGVITPYNSQASLIRSVVGVPVEIHTIDKYQGRDKDCVLVSFVRSCENSRACTSSLLGDWHRINVALTRAKKKLIMVGSCETLSQVPLLKLLIEKVDEQGGVIHVSINDVQVLRVKELRKCSQTSV